MPFTFKYVPRALKEYNALKSKAEAVATGRGARGKKKSSKDEGLFKHINKALRLLRDNPKHPGLKSHEYHSLEHPFDKTQKVWESYIQSETPGAYRLFWCYGPEKNETTIIAITPHP
jgi:hypothetical protein